MYPIKNAWNTLFQSKIKTKKFNFFGKVPTDAYFLKYTRSYHNSESFLYIDIGNRGVKFSPGMAIGLLLVCNDNKAAVFSFCAVCLYS